MSQQYRFLIRNRGYTRSKIDGINAHNERTKDRYRNCDLIPERSADNIHFKTPSNSYTAMLDEMLAQGAVSTRGLKADAILFDEFITDVNSRYFHEHGGLPFAEKFFACAHTFICEEVGEENILSSVVHADERNVALSEEFGCAVMHYHMHTVFLPTVKKEIKYSKRCKDPSLVGKTKCTIHQISHSKRWASEPILDENGKVVRDDSGNTVFDYSYSQLQTRFAEYMRAHGFDDVERGIKGSKAQHREIIDFKLEQDAKRAAQAQEQADRLEQENRALETAIEKNTEVL